MRVAFVGFFYYISCMWIKKITKRNSPKGKTFTQFQLTQSAREDGKVKQISILFLGSEPLLHDDAVRKLVAKLLEDKIYNQTSLDLDNTDIKPEILELVDRFYQKYLVKYSELSSIEKPTQNDNARFEKVDLNSTAVKDAKEIGAEYLAYQMFDKLEIGKYLNCLGWNAAEIDKAKISIISRAVYPASENKTAQWLNQNSGLNELFENDHAVTDRFQLYRTARKLYSVKDSLCEYLYQKSTDMFNIEDNLVIYDLTNTHFEGRKVASDISRYGKNKQKRNDCPQVVLAAVVNRYGFLRESKIYQGNISEPETLSDIIDQLSQKGDSDFNVVIDAGIATEKNLEMLRSRNIKYIAVARKKLKDYQSQIEGEPVTIKDRRDKPIEIKKIPVQQESWFYIKSQEKTKKELSILQKHKDRYVIGLQGIKNALGKKRGAKTIEKVWEKIGRLKQRNQKVNKYYQIEVIQNDGIVTDMSWKEVKMEERSEQSGVYFIRTNINQINEKTMWDLYNTIREVESTFRCLKNDLNLRPVYHKADENIEAHLSLGLIAYCLVAPIRYMLRQNGLTYDWHNIVRIMNTQKLCTVELKCETKNVKMRMATAPIKEVQEIYKAAGFNCPPIKSKKHVVYH